MRINPHLLLCAAISALAFPLAAQACNPIETLFGCRESSVAPRPTRSNRMSMLNRRQSTPSGSMLEPARPKSPNARPRCRRRRAWPTHRSNILRRTKLCAAATSSSPRVAFWSSTATSENLPRWTPGIPPAGKPRWPRSKRPAAALRLRPGNRLRPWPNGARRSARNWFRTTTWSGPYPSALPPIADLD